MIQRPPLPGYLVWKCHRYGEENPCWKALNDFSFTIIEIVAKFINQNNHAKGRVLFNPVFFIEVDSLKV